MSKPWILFPIVFPILYLLLWMFVLRFLSWMGGWARLAEQFREERPFLGEIGRFESARFGWVNYNWMLTIGVGPAGLSIVPLRIFRPFHHALLLPWSEISAEALGHGTFRRLRLTFPKARGCRIVLYSRTAERVLPFLDLLLSSSP